MEAQARIRENWMTLGDETAISQSSLTRDLSLQASSLEAGLLLCVLRQNPMFFCCSINVTKSCRFAPRCVYAKPECFENEPQLEEIEKDHFVKCHFVREINGL